MGHYSKGSEKPALKKDVLRLYSMRFCPFAQRARLVLAAKGIEYECVNINLKDKPEWFLDLNPVGKVPTLEHPDGKVIYESAICCDYLEDLYPDKARLHPADPYKKYKHRVLVETVGSALISAFYKSAREGTEEAKEEFNKHLASFEKYLKDLNTKLIGGDNPGMGDYLMWPWFERLLVLQPVKPVCDLDKFPAVSAWCAAMSEVPAVNECSYPVEMHLKFFEGYKAGNPDSQLVGIDQKA